MTLEAGITEKLREFSRQLEVTVFPVLLSIFGLLLGRLSGQDELCIGTPVSIRQPSTYESNIGFFLNTLALPVRWDKNSSFLNFLQFINQLVMDALENRSYPFERLVQQLKIDHSMGESPLFQVMFNYYPAALPKLDLPGIQSEWFSIETGSAKFDLNLYVSDGDEYLMFRLVYDAELFKHETAQDLLIRYCSLLQEVLSHPDQSIQNIFYPDPVEQEEVLRLSSGQETKIRSDILIHQFFEAQVELRPDAPAVLFAGDRMSFSELNRKANRLAHLIRQIGFGSGHKVAILLPRSSDLVISFLAILKTGAAFVPLDPDYPPARLAVMAAASQADLLITKSTLPGSLLSQLDPVFTHKIYLDRDQDLIDNQASENLNLNFSSDNLACIYFTSGTTGKPKGVLDIHKGIVNYLNYLVDVYGFDSRTTVLQITSIGFDASLRDFFLPLSVGGKVVLLHPEEVNEPGRLVDVIKSNQINTILSVVPTYLRMLMESFPAGSLQDGLINWLMVSGEILHWEDVGVIRQVFGRSVQVVNQYGPTETSMTCSYFAVNHDLSGNGALPIGRPVPNVQIYVLDDALNVLPFGVQGDIFIGGTGVSQGYIGMPAETARVFLPDPFSKIPGSRMYYSGDQGRYLRDGNLEFLGRNDQQVKINGVRVELGDVEAALRGHLKVKECAVICWKGASQENRLVAFVVLKPGSITDPQALRGYLADLLPSYMLPAEFLFRTHLPVSPTGKADRSCFNPGAR